VSGVGLTVQNSDARGGYMIRGGNGADSGDFSGRGRQKI